MYVTIGLSPAFLRSRFNRIRSILQSDSMFVDQSMELMPVNFAQAVPAPHKSKTSTSKRTKKKKFLDRALSILLSFMIVLSVFTAGAFFGPQLYYAIFPSSVKVVQAEVKGSAVGGAFDQGTATNQASTYTPEYNPDLPTGNWLVVPKIGVRSVLQSTQDPDQALDTGLWMAPDYGKPGDLSQPIIIAGHRYGFQWWWQNNSEYWRYNSFYLLPDLQPGDRVEIIADQRKWIFEIYAGEEGQEITDYQADLILYTCKYLNSPLRHFRYARLVDPTVDSQNLQETKATQD